MHKEKIKNLLLLLLVSFAIFLSSQVWLKFPFENYRNTVNVELPESIYLWDKIRPAKYVLTDGREYRIHNSECCEEIWEVFIESIGEIVRYNEFEGVEADGKVENRSISVEFDSPIPTVLFIEGMDTNNNQLQSQMENIKKISYDFDQDEFLVSDGRKTLSFAIDTNVDELFTSYGKAMTYARGKYSESYVSNYGYNEIPISTSEVTLNPVFVKSEIDIDDTEQIEEIAKNYFEEDFDYVRKSVDSSGSVNYIYKNEKVLKINKDGLLEFYDSIESSLERSDVYESFKIALSFMDDFLGFPENAYLSEVEIFQKDGEYGYSYIFSYNLLNKPIIFSQVRDEKAIQIDVLGSKVVLYKRFIRVVDYSMEAEMEEVEVLSPDEIISKNIDFVTELYLERSGGGPEEFEFTKSRILNSIYNIELAYFDPSRKLKDQLLRTVWVIRTSDRQYVFNAISGAIIEETVVGVEE
jgi:hypothetical protein